ncbi:MAG: HD-GYP domain-containing protein, partial [Polyangiaceae bacterium]
MPSRSGSGKRKAARPLARKGGVDVTRLKKAYVELEEVHRQIRESHIELILNLAIAAEYKDPDTGNHILRVSDYATELGKVVGLSGDDLEILRYASPMHDIGKIGIPDTILRKPGPLTPEEYDIVKQHVALGDMIVRDVPNLDRVRA